MVNNVHKDFFIKILGTEQILFKYFFFKFMLPYTKKYLFRKSNDTVVRENELLLGGWESTDPPVRTPDFKFF